MLPQVVPFSASRDQHVFPPFCASSSHQFPTRLLLSALVAVSDLPLWADCRNPGLIRAGRGRVASVVLRYLRLFQTHFFFFLLFLDCLLLFLLLCLLGLFDRSHPLVPSFPCFLSVLALIFHSSPSPHLPCPQVCGCQCPGSDLLQWCSPDAVSVRHSEILRLHRGIISPARLLSLGEQRGGGGWG